MSETLPAWMSCTSSISPSLKIYSYSSLGEAVVVIGIVVVVGAVVVDGKVVLTVVVVVVSGALVVVGEVVVAENY